MADRAGREAAGHPRKGGAKIPKAAASNAGSGGLAGCTRSVCACAQAMEQMVKRRGYKVKVSRGSFITGDAVRRRAAIAEVLARS